MWATPCPRLSPAAHAVLLVVLRLGEVRYFQREVAKSLRPRKEKEMTFFLWCLCARVCMRCCAGGADRELLGSPRPGTAPDAGRERRRGRPHTAATVPSPLPPAAPSHQHVPEEAQRLLRRLWLVGAFPFPPPSLPCEELSFPPRLRAGISRRCGAVPSRQSPSHRASSGMCAPGATCLPLCPQEAWHNFSPAKPREPCR